MKLQAGIQRHYKQPYRFVVFTDQTLKEAHAQTEIVPIPDPHLVDRSCFCRLRLFDPDWQAAHRFDDRIINLDLDIILTGKLEPLFDRPESFLILQGVNATNPNPFNCSLFMIRPGHHREVWSEFSLEKAQHIKHDAFPDDQGWIWHMLPEADGWRGGKASGIYAFQKPGWPGGTDLPADARMVVFFGKRKPEQFSQLPWMRDHWRT